ncbi:hypothetical protein [Brevundimonas sp.]
MKAIDRVTAIKAAIVFVAGIGTAVVLFVAAHLIFGFDWVSRGRTFDLGLSWFDLAWMVAPNLIIAFFLGRWWRDQDRLTATGSVGPKAIWWLVGYVVVTVVALIYYLQTFTELFTT